LAVILSATSLPPPTRSSCGMTQKNIFIADLLRCGTRIKEAK
jgi:hypothetical protein